MRTINDLIGELRRYDGAAQVTSATVRIKDGKRRSTLTLMKEPHPPKPTA